ncbi:MAG TPA: ABC transporter permease [Streptosporangiaceae bacterium]|nr:ABC transporter permease [Streptosporangiaceae bacterium]
MNIKSYALRDSATMLRRNLRHMLRYPGMTISVVAMPVIFLLLFLYVLGGALGAGLDGADHGHYIAYLTPGIIVLSLASASISTAVAVNTDMTKGIINRFRTMSIAQGSVLTGHVVGSVIQTVVSTALVTCVAVALGFRPAAGLGGWLAVVGLVIAVAFALAWLSVALGLVAKTPENASNLPMPLMFLPFLGSAFVPARSMAPGLRLFAQYQPFTPIINSLRDLLMGAPLGDTGYVAIGWCAGFALVGYLWARALFWRAASR